MISPLFFPLLFVKWCSSLFPFPSIFIPSYNLSYPTGPHYAIHAPYSNCTLFGPLGLYAISSFHCRRLKHGVVSCRFFAYKSADTSLCHASLFCPRGADSVFIGSRYAHWCKNENGPVLRFPGKRGMFSASFPGETSSNFFVPEIFFFEINDLFVELTSPLCAYCLQIVFRLSSDGLQAE